MKKRKIKTKQTFLFFFFFLPFFVRAGWQVLRADNHVYVITDACSYDWLTPNNQTIWLVLLFFFGFFLVVFFFFFFVFLFSAVVRWVCLRVVLCGPETDEGKGKDTSKTSGKDRKRESFKEMSKRLSFRSRSKNSEEDDANFQISQPRNFQHM